MTRPTLSFSNACKLLGTFPVLATWKAWRIFSSIGKEVWLHIERQVSCCNVSDLTKGSGPFGFLHVNACDVGVEDTLLFVDWKASLIPVRPIEAGAPKKAIEGQGERTRSRCLNLSGKRQVTNSGRFDTPSYILMKMMTSSLIEFALKLSLVKFGCG